MSRCCEDINCESMSSCLKGTFPIFSWLRTYKREDFMSDVISGCTVAVMHIPQGMGYALLANLPPVTGIYMAFFPVLLYVIFGTSRHNSMGKWLLGVEEITWRILHTSIKTHLPSFPTSSFSSFFLCVLFNRYFRSHLANGGKNCHFIFIRIFRLINGATSRIFGDWGCHSCLFHSWCYSGD